MFFCSRLFVTLASPLLAMCVATSALAERRALVIGNDAYTSIDTLRNAVSDAQAMAKALEKVGFKVAPPVLNADRERMLDAISRFTETLGSSDEAVVFYAGHAVEMKGVNYLLPVDIRSDNERSVTFNAVPLNYLLSSVGDQRPKFSLVVIDACRDNPFKGSGRNVNSRGLVPAGAAVAGQMVIYSASEGQKALDRLGPDDKSPNGVFTRVFVKAIEADGVHVAELMERIKEEVHRLALSVDHQQLPAFYNAAVGRYYFKGDASSARKPDGARTSLDEDSAAFEAAKAADVIEAYRAYLESFPKGRYAAAARIRVASLRKAATAVTPTPVADPYPAGKEFEDCSGCPRMVVVPGGSFVMGSPADEPIREDDETPQRTVQVVKFALGKMEVTRGEFRRFVRDTGRSVSGCWVYEGKEWKNDDGRNWESPGFDQTDDHPAVCVNWEDARAYAQWISRKSGQRYRLASEAEWEYAARAGSQGVRHWGAGEEEDCRYANSGDRAFAKKYNLVSFSSCDDGYSNTAPVGSYRANNFGLYDMLGNVLEWTEDCWNESYRGAPSDASPWTSGDCSRRATRGGNWYGDPGYLRSADRHSGRTAFRIVTLGFRIAKTLP